MNTAHFIQHDWSGAYGPEPKQRAAQLTVVRAIDLPFAGMTRMYKSHKSGRCRVLEDLARHCTGQSGEVIPLRRA
jgi:hypothetical protein